MDGGLPTELPVYVEELGGGGAGRGCDVDTLSAVPRLSPKSKWIESHKKAYYIRFLSESFLCDALGCNSGMDILLRWTTRLLGGSYLFLGSASRLILRGPFRCSRVSYSTYWCSSSSSDRPENNQYRLQDTVFAYRSCVVSASSLRQPAALWAQIQRLTT